MMSNTIDTDTGEVFAAPDPGTMNLFGLLIAQQEGGFVADCDHELRYVIARIEEIRTNENRKCKGEMTIKIVFDCESHAIRITAECKTKAPGPRPTIGLAFGDEDGNLHRQDPNQARMNFDRKAGFTRRARK